MGKCNRFSLSLRCKAFNVQKSLKFRCWHTIFSRRRRETRGVCCAIEINDWRLCVDRLRGKSLKLFECRSRGRKKSAEASPLINLFYARRVIYYREWVCCNNFSAEKAKSSRRFIKSRDPMSNWNAIPRGGPAGRLTAGLEIVSRFNLISEKREKTRNLKNYGTTFTFYFLLSQQSQHTSVWYTRATKQTLQTPPIWRRMFNVEKVKRRKVILKKIITLCRVKCLNVPSLMPLMSDSWFYWECLWVRLGVDGIFISLFAGEWKRKLLAHLRKSMKFLEILEFRFES